jgi:hypothetical protein
MAYSTEATSVPGFVQQLAVGYVSHGYYFYVTGRVPRDKDPRAVDEKLLARYGIGISKWARARRKAAGLSNLHYLRFQRFFVLLATHGAGAFFEEEAAAIRDIRRVPLRFSGYAVGYRGGHVQVRIERQRYSELKAYLVELASRGTVDEVAAEFRSCLRFEPYAPVRSQSLCILRAVNRARQAAGLPDIPRTCLRFRRRVIRPFEAADDTGGAA